MIYVNARETPTNSKVAKVVWLAWCPAIPWRSRVDCGVGPFQSGRPGVAPVRGASAVPFARDGVVRLRAIVNRRCPGVHQVCPVDLFGKGRGTIQSTGVLSEIAC